MIRSASVFGSRPRFASASAVAFTATLVSTSLGFAGNAANAWAADPAAEQLYQEGRRAASDKDWGLACTKFRESEAREPAPGTLLNLADCEDKLGQLLQAKQHFEVAARSFRAGDQRAGYALQRATALDLRIPHLLVRLAAGSPADATVERDGVRMDIAPPSPPSQPSQPLAPAQPVPIDPGTHILIVRAAGHADARTELKIAEGDAPQLEVSVGPVSTSPSVVSTPVVPIVQPTATPTQGPTPASLHQEPPPKEPGNATFGLGLVSMVVGGAGVGFGLIAGLVTLNAKSTADTQCMPSCSQDGLDAETRGKTWSAISTTSVIVGSALFATGVTLVIVGLASHGGASGSASASAHSGAGTKGWSSDFSTAVSAAPVPGGGSFGLRGTF